MKYLSLAFYVLLNLDCFAQDSGSQNQFNISIGIGSTESYNLALKYQTGQIQYGLSYGAAYLRDANVTAFSIFGYRHLFGRSNLTDRKPWFIRGGASYLRKEQSNELWYQTVYGSVYFGRDINLTRRLGLAFSVGPAVSLYSKYEDDPSKRNAFVLPGLDANVFYRFL